MNRFETQTLRAAIAELGEDLQSKIADPGAKARIVMTRFLLAHVLGQQNASDVSTIAEEVSSLQRAEQDEQALQLTTAQPDLAVAPINAQTLTTYLREKLVAPNLVVTNVRASLGGFSKQTWILEISGAETFGNGLVLRRDQAGGPVEVKTADEYPVIRLLFDRGVPVPEPLIVDREAPFGGTLMVMRRVAGASPFDVSGQVLGPDGRSASLALARVLAKIHGTPISALPIDPELATRSLSEHVRRLVSLYEAQWERRHVASSPTLRAAFAWLYDNVPDTQAAPVLVHGDASLRNLMVHEDRESAMLDWELWHVGDASEDLAYCRADVEQALPFGDFLREYHAHGGRPFDPAASEYYAVFGAVRNAVFAQSCLHDLLTAECPETKFAYGGLVLGRRLIYDLADRLGR